ncbi:hypothetical protein DAPPUDRAFT_314769 [Daphnia pulex]|uniref:Uncharacterized protein n=1 Tax=Daphnia pulex TaxID=6669 RepID=E9G7E1_DAPPU|nr:hypothetical protein DAPPUDRAFT_314769 [Daphnia pulex]|eukprot:EFX84454.1 hypothetical protein DAPPUDRAFT_314769 [Daphnia pulex]
MQESYGNIIKAMGNLQVDCSNFGEGTHEKMQGTYRHVLYFSQCFTKAVANST